MRTIVYDGNTTPGVLLPPMKSPSKSARKTEGIHMQTRKQTVYKEPNCVYKESNNAIKGREVK